MERKEANDNLLHVNVVRFMYIMIFSVTNNETYDRGGLKGVVFVKGGTPLLK